MKQAANNPVAQGDVIFVPVESIPEGLTEEKREVGRLIVTHSETGHHHAIDSDDARMFTPPNDPLTAYLSVEGCGVELVHHRSIDTHESIFFQPGKWQIFRQREHAPDGWRRVED
jgi:hypothetical protein